jgi:hypothetical protein
MLKPVDAALCGIPSVTIDTGDGLLFGMCVIGRDERLTVVHHHDITIEKQHVAL